MIHGLLLLDKPEGFSSHDMVFHVRRALNTRAVGHCGTLDPMATGLMVMLIGDATKLSQYILERNKSYDVTAELGYTTDTLDRTGTELTRTPDIANEQEALHVAQGLVGDFDLPVPIYSAAKVDGKKLYEYARSGAEVEIPRKVMTFFDIKNLSTEPGLVRASLSCTKGSFIRSWVQLLGEKLGCGACMTALRRTESAPYSLSEAITLEQLAKISADQVQALPAFKPMSRVLPEVPAIRVKGLAQVMLLNGLISHDLRSRLIATVNPEKDQLVKIVSVDSELLALVALDPGKGFVIRRVFPPVVQAGL